MTAQPTLLDAPPRPDALGPGIHDAIDHARYLADPCDQPSLSASIAHILVSRSPLHAWAAHPRLGRPADPPAEPRFDVGTLAHALLLNGDDICTVIDAADWRTNDAKTARDDARANGRIPLLTHQYLAVTTMVEAVRHQLDQLDAITPPLIADGKPEQTLVWEEDGVTCRARLDWLRSDGLAIDDLKTTANANPAEWSRRRMFDIGADLQCAMYLRGLKALAGIEPAFRFVVCEVGPPYAVSVVSLAPSALELARDKVQHAIDTWRRCLQTGEWPGYIADVAYAEAPGWHMEQWLEARALDEATADQRSAA